MPRKKSKTNLSTDMKKILLLIAIAGLLMGFISCSDDNEPKRGDGVFIVNTAMINHMVNTGDGTVIGIGDTHNKLTIDTGKHTAQVVLNYDDGNGPKSISLTDIKAMPKRLGFYELTMPDNAQVKGFKGYVDFNEGSLRYRYTTADGIRVISTTPEVFFLKTKNVITYDDTTKTTTMDNVMYQFEVSPLTQKAIVKVMGIEHAKEMKYFINITASSVPFTVTANGYSITGDNIPTSAVYRNLTDSTGVPTTKTSDKFPFKTFDANVDLANDSLIINFMMGSSATVVASGRTYPDYTAY